MARRQERNNRAEPRDERDEHIMQASCLAEQAGQCQGVPLRSLILLSVSSQAGNLITDNFASRRAWGLYLDSRMSRSRESTRHCASWLGYSPRRITEIRERFDLSVDLIVIGRYRVGIVDSIFSNLLKKIWGFNLGRRRGFCEFFDYRMIIYRSLNRMVK